MEYSIEIDAGMACLEEVLQTIERDQIDVAFPLEVRCVKGDETQARYELRRDRPYHDIDSSERRLRLRTVFQRDRAHIRKLRRATTWGQSAFT
ncbi:MAG: hypothetical protein ACI8Z1_000918 [Candidatus Azotimanducaceae bacterium]|jgi:hypothetical protein